MLIKSSKSIHHDTIKMLIYGPSGAGKTTIASTLDHAKTLIVSAESGLMSISQYSIDVVDLTVDKDDKLIGAEQRMSNIREVYNFLVHDTKYENVFIDSLTEIAQIVLGALEKKYPDQKQGLLKWGEYNKAMTAIIAQFRDLKKNVIFTCLSEVDRDENNMRFQAFSMPGSISQKLPQYFDEVFFLHSAKNQEGKITRKLQTQNDSVIQAKDRSSKLDLYENPDLNLIFNKIRQQA